MKYSKFKKEIKNEYNNNFNNKEEYIVKKKKTHVPMSPRTKLLIPLLSIAAIILSFGIAVLVDYSYVNIYNAKVDAKLDKQIDDYIYSVDTHITKIENKSQLDKLSLKTTYKDRTIKLPSISGFFSMGSKGNAMSPSVGIDDAIYDAPADIGTSDSSANTNATAIDTNIQVAGVDEADIAKCDGKNIFYIYLDTLYVYNIESDNTISLELENNYYNYSHMDYYQFMYNDKIAMRDMYVKDDNIIIISYKYIAIYSFTDTEIKLEKNYYYQQLIDTRLIDNQLYFVTRNYNDGDIDYHNLYYIDYCAIRYVYSFTKLDIDTLEEKKISNINSSNVHLYMDKDVIALASSDNIFISDHRYGYVSRSFTCTLLLDLDLNILGAVKTRGTILNQFSMNSDRGCFMIATTNNSYNGYTRCIENSLFIYDISTLKLKSQVNNIGLENQEIKSCRFEGNKCFIVTYYNTDPLYEISLEDLDNPQIVDVYKAPGYSSYLHPFVINGNKYLLGLGYTDDRKNKISVYQDLDVNVQIGADYVIPGYYDMLSSHKNYMFYNDGEKFYVGFNSEWNKYEIFEIDVTNNEEAISVKNSFDVATRTRCFLVDGVIYIPNGQNILVENF